MSSIWSLTSYCATKLRKQKFLIYNLLLFSCYNITVTKIRILNINQQLTTCKSSVKVFFLFYTSRLNVGYTTAITWFCQTFHVFSVCQFLEMNQTSLRCTCSQAQKPLWQTTCYRMSEKPIVDLSGSCAAPSPWEKTQTYRRTPGI